MNKIPCASQNMEAKTLPTDVCIFGCFGQLSLAAIHLADRWFVFRVKWWIHISSIVTYLNKNFFLLCWNSCKHSESSAHWFWLIVNKCDTHFEHSFLIDKCSCKMVITQPSDILNYSAISYNFNLQSAKTSLEFFGVFQDKYRIWASWVSCIICVSSTVFKVNIPPLKCCFQQSRVRITLIKPLLCLNSIFPPHQKTMLYQHTKFRFFHRFENLQQ